MSRLWLIVPAAGVGRRMAADCPKQYLPLAGSTVLAQTLARLHAAFPTATLCLCLARDDVYFDAAMVPFADWRRIGGGAERAESVAAALTAIAAEAAADDAVLVHDAARPCVSVDDLTHLQAALVDEPDGALLAVPVADTMKRAAADGRVARTEPRDALWHALTPQGARYGLLCDALAAARARGVAPTDEASALEALGRAPRLVAGRRDNLKITHPDDLALAEQILAAQAAQHKALT
ncbi:2-C-methyl-D-erythritol 4-phosphate cytidylyltransferase [Franzmannia qiaohouensis]|uniref:2-C-methyl-D-erythritol 4-phosphate cytidylyltransferase n=1 Tax=Franzmannia qiaohouensis TaxID=1329370 RepID=A0ABU1HAB2_9GAMM|nr:2-C-methyl-D-erythritol 4-phosphate cytidylyltransferase [Halomonas qiaohouensis]MDR5904397.1 2-C-methyl-D-erythritol 4-phosphate cytidylyltransferase [Halomonas qiaohouensis]